MAGKSASVRIRCRGWPEKGECQNESELIVTARLGKLTQEINLCRACSNNLLRDVYREGMHGPHMHQ